MSVRVSAAEVPDRLVDYGYAPFLVTVSPDGTPKLVHVSVSWDVKAAAFRCMPGGGTVRNLAGSRGDRPATLVFPGPNAESQSWLVDTWGAVDPNELDSVILAYKSGVLHRPAPSSADDQQNC